MYCPTMSYFENHELSDPTPAGHFFEKHKRKSKKRHGFFNRDFVNPSPLALLRVLPSTWRSLVTWQNGGEDSWQTRLIVKLSYISLRDVLILICRSVCKFYEISIICEHVTCFFRSPQIEVTDDFKTRQTWKVEQRSLLSCWENDIQIILYDCIDR